MKNLFKSAGLILTILMFSGSTSFAEGVPKGFTIKVTVKGKVNGRKVYLWLKDEGRKPLDSTVVKNNTFQFKGRTDGPRLYKIRMDKDAKNESERFGFVIPVFVENKNIRVTVQLDGTLTELQYTYTGGFGYHKIKVEGSPVHDQFMKYIDGFEPLKKVYRNAFDAYISYLNSRKRKALISEGIRLTNRIDSTKNNLTDYVKTYIRENNTSPVAIHAAEENISSFSVKEIEELLSTLSPVLLASANGKSFVERANIIKRTAVGAKFVDFEFKDKDGNSVKLSDHLGKGKYVLLEFWASWCHPCRADIPHLKEVYELYHPAGFEVISVSMDDKKDNWLKALADEKMSWLQVSDLKAFAGDFSKIYNFNGIPTCVLVGPDGDIVTRNMRGRWMDQKLIEFYGNKFGDKF
jgi:thiol-disulfide isomerase/thioredoxin